jgi:histidinol-phosphate aminotransferase
VVVVDEAYYEFYGQSLAPLLLERPNGVVVRTFSKAYGLAGARVGYLAASLDITRTIDAIRLPQNLTAFGVTAACRALADKAGLAERVAAILGERARLGDELRRRGWEVRPSEANFVLARPPRPAAELARWLQSGGLVVRSYAGHPRLDAWLRITVRSPEEDDRLLARLDALPAR